MRYFLAIIGGGPAGYTAAEQATKAGKSVVLFEQQSLGGTCLNVGCIPTKCLLHDTHRGITDWTALQQHKTRVVRKLVAGIKMRLKDVTIVAGHAEVHDGRVFCQGEAYEYDNLLICTGSSNLQPPIPGIQDNDAVWDSTDALNASEPPQSVVIVGGGVIGMEFATIYHALGIPVTIIEALPHIIANIDQEVVQLLYDKYSKEGIVIHTNTKVSAIDGHVVHTTQGEFEGDKILISVGRKPNMADFEALQGQPNVYFAGDVTKTIMLAHVAERQAAVAVNTMLGIPDEVNYEAIPAVVYTQPEIAMVGVMEGEVRTMPMSYAGRFVVENDRDNGLCKMAVEPQTGKIKGVTMIGTPCSEIIAAASVAITQGMTVDELKKVVFPHPTVSEILKEIL